MNSWKFQSSVQAAIIATLLSVALGVADFAQAEPSDAQVAAIRSNCRSDYMSYCSSVPRGGAASLQCLQKNVASLSTACQTAVKAAMPQAPAPAPTQHQAAPVAPAPSVPAANAETPAPAEIAKPAPVPTAKPVETPATASAPATTTEPASSTPAAPQTPANKVTSTPASPAKTAAPPAKQAATPSEPAPSPSAGAAPAAPPQPTAEPSPTIRIVRPGQALLVLRGSCRGDFRNLCPDVDLGGGRAIACLQQKLESLSPGCRGAIAELVR